jgi:phosphatidylinositol alpha-1,6-mannosyltransferase
MARWAAPFYWWWLRQTHYDWVIVAFAGYGEATALRHSSRQAICVILHYPYQQVPHRYAEFKATGLAARATLLVGVSQFTARGAEAFFGKPCHVIPNGVDAEVFKPSEAMRAEMRQRLGISPTAPVIITTAALEERKGIQHVIRAVAALKPTMPDLRYWVLGNGPYRPDLERLIDNLQVGDQVHLIGSVNDVVPYLAMADVGCLLSYGEAFGIALVEYMTMQLPCIASQHPPFDEMIRPEYGLMLDEKQSDALIEALRDLLTDPAKRLRMGQAGRQQAIARYNWRDIAAQYLALFRLYG